jgi:hypothetical protein
MLKCAREFVADAIEFGGLRVPSVMTENLEPFHDNVVTCEFFESRDETLCLSLPEPADLVCRCLADSGTPSHFELTLGMFPGSFFVA